MDMDDLTPQEVNVIILRLIPAVIASIAARIFDPEGDALGEVVKEQIVTAETELGMSGVEFGLFKLQAAERVGVWLVSVISQLTGEPPEAVLLHMTQTAAEEGIEGQFGTGTGS